MPEKCVDVGTKALMQEFEKFVTKDQAKKNHDNLLDELKLTIIEGASSKHQWDTKAMDSLVKSLTLLKNKLINLIIFILFKKESNSIKRPRGSFSSR